MDPKPQARQARKGFASVSFMLALVLIALLGAALYQKLYVEPARAAGLVLTPVEGDPFADLIPKKTKEQGWKAAPLVPQVEQHNADTADEQDILTNEDSEVSE